MRRALTVASLIKKCPEIFRISFQFFRRSMNVVLLVDVEWQNLVNITETRNSRRLLDLRRIRAGDIQGQEQNFLVDFLGT